MTYISVIIPTFNKSPLVCDIVEDLHNQTFQDFEVIVVDDGSTDDTVRALRELRRQQRHMKIKVYQTGLTDEFGMCKAINTGLRKASGPITFLMNDDIYLHPTCLEQHMFAHKRIRSRHAFLGPRFRCPPYALGKLYTDTKTKKYCRRKYEDRGKTTAGYPLYRKKMMVSSNISVSTDKLCAAGGYNEYFEQYTGAIDRDLYNRLLGRKVKTLFLYQAQAYSINYGHPLYRETAWLTDNSTRGGQNVSDWKREQMRRTERLERKAWKHAPKPIKRRGK